MMEKKQPTLETLIRLHGWFENLCKYSDGEAWKDRSYAEGQLFACREAIGNFTYKYKEVSRGFKMEENEFFLSGYSAFQEEYRCDHVRFGV